MPRTQQQQAGSRGRWCLLPLLLLAGALSSRPSHAAIHIPSTCEYSTHTHKHTHLRQPGSDGRWRSACTGGFKDVFVVLIAGGDYQRLLLAVSHSR